MSQKEVQAKRQLLKQAGASCLELRNQKTYDFPGVAKERETLILKASIPEMHGLLIREEVTCVEIVSVFA